ncbi:PEBP-like protein [Lophiostoma macrostomum CBS 122681]|uniref:PEBP-like protein n=1 Tax=Lophiostoma macrostomum CBS 122681 TaxID=1314788 RepID=A0A6A6T6S1_9PLEO|nr:PEBP-like protein [Lophiostoma macrostomum CBS 122681]
MPTQIVARALKIIEEDTSKILGLALEKHANIQPGQLIPKADAATPPELQFAAASPDKSYIAICLDLDAPFASIPFASPINHWTQSGFRLSTSAGNGRLETSDPFIVNWAPPGPPPISGPHRYLFALYEEPSGFDVKSLAPGKEVGIPPRFRYNVDAWARSIGLGHVLAANYFRSK